MKTQHTFECAYCSATFVIEGPTLHFTLARKMLHEDNWLLLGDGFEDAQTLCAECAIKDAKGV